LWFLTGPLERSFGIVDSEAGGRVS